MNCITRLNGNQQHEHITHIGNTIRKWCITVEEVIVRIESNAEAFYVVDPASQKRIYVGVVKERGKRPYLRTCVDGIWTNDLLAQVECGVSNRVIGES